MPDHASIKLFSLGLAKVPRWLRLCLQFFGAVALSRSSSTLASNEGAAIGEAFAEIMNYAAVYIASLLLALTSLVLSRRTNRKWYIAAVLGAATVYALLLVIIVYSNDSQLYKSFSALYYAAIVINCMIPTVFYVRERPT